MIPGEEHLCMIPARGGSRRLPGKNKRLLDGRPLFTYTTSAALGSELFTDIVVSTNDPEIARLALQEGVKVDERPAELASDKATQTQVVQEFLVRNPYKRNYKTVTVLLPTCPFRHHDHLVEAHALFRNNSVPFLVSVTEFEFPVQLALLPVDEHCMVVKDREAYRNTQSQGHEKHYHPNGAIYIASVPEFLERGTFFGEKMLAYRMTATDSIDIDHEHQFDIANFLMQKKHGKK